jgi:hypothetical protein
MKSIAGAPACPNSLQLLLQAIKIVMLTGEQFQRHRVDGAARVAACAVSLETALTQVIENGLGHVGARRISGADEQHIVNLVIVGVFDNSVVYVNFLC